MAVDEDRLARSSQIQLDGGREEVGDQGGPDAEAGEAMVDREPADEKGGYWVG
jgi:hypothetical protein